MKFPSSEQLKQVLDIKLQIESLEGELQALLGGQESTVEAAAPPRSKGISAAGRARIAAAQRARWARLKDQASTVGTEKRRRKMSAEARARISAIARRRWRLAKAAGRSTL